jgi:hypothetical protein
LHCIKTKLLPIALSDTLKELLELREADDYELIINDIENIAKQYYQQAENFLREVEIYVKIKAVIE